MTAIRRITLDNYKSFGHVDFDLTDGKDPLPYAFVYGENGSGKTNLLETISYLKDSVLTLSRGNEVVDRGREYVEAFGTLIGSMGHDFDREEFGQSFMDILLPKDITHLASRHRMIGSAEDMRICIVFDIDGRDATYEMVFNGDNNLVSESLKCVANERTSTLYQLTADSGAIAAKFSRTFFVSSTYEKTVRELISKHWGKHSFLSIMNYETVRNNSEFMEKSVSGSFFRFMAALEDIKVENGPYSEMIFRERSVRYNPESGIIEKSRMGELKRYESALNKAFTRIYSDVRRVYFELSDRGEDRVEYSLIFVRHIHGQDREISAEFESSGTEKLLEILPFLLDCANGKAVLIDEMDSGIHDKLVFDLIREVLGEIKGQLIVTTHNTSLLRILDPANTFIINVDLNGEREIRSVKKILRTQKNNNNQDRYLKGMMDGVPYMGSLDLDEIASSLENDVKGTE